MRKNRLRRNPSRCCAEAVLALLLLLVPVAWSQSAHAESDALVRVLSTDGRWIAGKLHSIDADRWSVIEANSATERVLPCSDVIAFITQRTIAVGGVDADSNLTAPAPISFGLLETNDGQRLPGNFRAALDRNYWDHRWIGAIPLSMEQVASIRFRGSLTPTRREDGDTVLFLNGDTTTGFVESLGSDIAFEPIASNESPAGQAGSERRKLSNDRIAAIAFARTPDGSDAQAKQTSERQSGARIWAVDGSVVDGDELQFDIVKGWGFRLSDPLLLGVRPTMTTDNSAANPVAGLLYPSRLLPLAVLGKPSIKVPTGSFHYAIANASHIGSSARALLGLALIEFAGPLTARYELPPSVAKKGNAIVFSCEIALSEPAPMDARVEVDFTFGSTHSERFVLDANHRRIPISIRESAANATTLEMRITDGGNGIAGDRIELDRACFIIVAQ